MYMPQEELGVEYEIKRYQRTPLKLAPKELKEIHPLGKSPVITDGDVTVAESGAIVGTSFAVRPAWVAEVLYDRLYH